MPNPSSGPISLQTVQAAFGYRTYPYPNLLAEQIDMNLNPVVLGAGSSQGAQTQMSGFYYTQSSTVPYLFANTGTGSSGTARQGVSVSISNDGLTMAMGGNTDNTNIGAVWIFTRSTPTSTTWTQQGLKLVGTGGVGTPKQGTSVALSANGNYLVVGGSNDNGGIGAVWVWTRSGTTWTQQTKLVPTGYTGTPAFGTSVAILPDCDALAVGAPNNSSGYGGVWVFSRSVTTWTQASITIPSGLSTNSAIGSSIAFAQMKTAESNNTGRQYILAMGAPNYGTIYGGNPQGCVFIYSAYIGNLNTFYPESGGSMGLFLGSGASGTQNAKQGTSIALSPNGNTLAVGGPYNSVSGSVWVWSRTLNTGMFETNTWSQQELITPPASYTLNWGSAVALSADGNVMVTSGWVGEAMYVYTRSGFVWNTPPTLITGGHTSGGLSTSRGYSLSMTGNGNSIAFGAPSENTNIGGFWVSQ